MMPLLGDKQSFEGAIMSHLGWKSKESKALIDKWVHHPLAMGPRYKRGQVLYIAQPKERGRTENNSEIRTWIEGRKRLFLCIEIILLRLSL
jgi:hypothetical protein